MTAQKPLVLIADDERNAVVLLKRIFEREGFSVEDAQDGQTALQMALDLLPDLILMDVQMPKLNGFEVTERLRQNHRTARIPVIFVTAAARDPADVAHGLKLGADDYVRKPYNYHELLARARSKMRARQLEDRLQRRTEQLEALVRIGGELNQRLALGELTERILEIVVQEIACQDIELFLFDKDQQPTLYRTLSEGEMVQSDAQQRLGGAPSAVREVFETREPAVQNASGEVLRVTDWETREFQPNRAAAPLNHHGALLGIIAVLRADGQSFSEAEIRMLRSIGEQAALAVRNAQLYDELRSYAQNLEAMVQERTEELRAAEAQLMRSEKLAALGRLAAGIAHEVNNPLQPVLNCLEVAIEDIEQNGTVDTEVLRVAENEVQRIKTIVSRLLDFSRPSTSDKSTVDLRILVNEVLALTQRQLERMRIRVQTTLQPVPEIIGNSTQLKQVMLNFLLNAMQAMPDGGELRIDLYTEHDGVCMAVTDSGIGMDEQTIAQIFDPFYSTKEDGTGLGLAVSYGIVQGHDGDIRVESRPGQGSCFTLWLPLVN